MGDEFSYNFNNDRRGIALLIHNEEFDKRSGYKDRPGDTGDFERMMEIFHKLGFQVHPHRNLTATEMWIEAKKVANSADVHKKSDCFVCVVASHGEEMELGQKKNVKIKEHVILGTDGQGIKTRDLVEMFDGDHCEELKDKPKFFFIQACRTNKDTVLGMDKGHTVTVTNRVQHQTESPQKLDDLDNVDSKSNDDLDTRHLSSAELYLTGRQLVHHITDVECPEDTLLMFASLSHNYAVRNSTAGGWLLTSLYSQLRQFLEDDKLWTTEFSQILIATLKEMTTKNYKPSDISSPLYGAFSPGCFTHCLTKHVFFTKKS